MKKHKLTKKHRILWDTATKEIIEEIEDAGNSTTECWRDSVESFETNDKAKKAKKITDSKLKRKDKDEGRINETTPV